MKKLLDEAADQLARIDEQAYRRGQIRDASEVLSQLIMPMSLPWTHRIAAYRVVSRDIDELEGIVDCEEEFPGEDRIGPLGEAQTCTIPEHQAIAASRSDQDPGVINFVRFRVPKSVDPPIELVRQGEVNSDWMETEGRASLGFLGVTLWRKRRRNDVIEEKAERFSVSLCFGGSSSRSTLKPPDLSSAGEPFVLLAKLPNEIAGGMRMEASRALAEATHLGSYDHRHGLPRLSDSAKRVRTGRSRTIWSSKGSISQRPLHKSLLTGGLLETGQQRRPSHVKVFVRSNGGLLMLDKKHRKKEPEGEEDDEWAGAGYTNQVVETALQLAEGQESNEVPPENLQCSFDSTIYFESIRKRSSAISQFIKRTREPYFVKVVEKDRLWLSIRPPQLWSNPCEDGVFQVVYSQTGQMNGIQYTNSASMGRSAGQNYPWATAIFLDATAKRQQACCVCWSESEDEDELVICTSCQVQVHPKCYFGKKVFDPKWVCDSCLDYQKHANALPASLTPLNVRWARKCGLCEQFGSAVALHDSLGSNNGVPSWVHVYCRTWEHAKAFEEGICVLCSTTSQYLVRCAANGCSVKFHPMCAVVASHAASSGRASDHTFLDGAIEREEDRDVFLCTKYCHEVATLSFGTKQARKRSIPVAYCGLHNPGRTPDRYGLMPGSAYFRDAVRLPFKRGEGLNS